MIGSEFQSHVTPPEGFQALVIGSFRNLGDSVLYHAQNSNPVEVFS